MESILFEGQITATSNKTDGKFKTENPTKTAYLKVDDVAEQQKLIDFGLTLYSSNTNPDEKFFIVKLSREVKLYNALDKNEKPTIKSGLTDTPNFKTDVVAMNLLKGENMGNDFYRVNAILVSTPNDIEDIEAENPFA